MNYLISYPCVTCLSSWVTALLEMLVRKPSGFKILLCDCHLLFTFCLHVSEWNQWCQTLLCSRLHRLKIFWFCNTEDMVLNFFVVFHASNVESLHRVHTVTLWAPQLCLRQKVAHQLCKAWQVCPGLGARGSASGSTWGAAQVGQGAAGCAWWILTPALQQWLTGDLLRSSQFSSNSPTHTDVSSKSSREKHATQALPLLLLSCKVNIK